MIENLTSPGQSPIDGDLIKITHASGATETKRHWSPIVSDDRLRIAVTSLVCDQPNSLVSGNEVTCLEDAIITATVELHYPNDTLVPLTMTFRMPVVARDGREIIVLAPFIDGVATISATFRASGVWQVTEAAINADIPPEMAMAFDGLAFFVGAK